MIYRIDVTAAPVVGDRKAAVDPLGESIRQQIAELGTSVGPVTTARIFLLDTDATRQQIDRVARELLADPVVETATVVTAAPADKGVSRIEVHIKPGVMDPVAASTEMAIGDMGIHVRQVRTGRAYLIQGQISRQERATIAGRVLANGVVESVHFDAFLPQTFPAGHDYQFQPRQVPLRQLDEQQLNKLSREAHLFLSLAEMKAVQTYYCQQNREPSDIELETLAQTWSEHCVHKTLKSAVDLELRDPDGKVVGQVHYDNLIKDTIFKSTVELMDQSRQAKDEFCLSVFVDNAGVIAFDDVDAVCFKVETHNHPSAIEPYGGSATGIGGVIRDVLGTGLAAKPIANTDVFCVAYPDYGETSSSPCRLPKGIIHPKRILQQIVAGVRDYGNRMGIPTVNGGVYFDDRYLGNPLVFCGCAGLIPRHLIQKETRHGDAIVVMGGRTGRDGIHGATFSSAELTDTHADEFSHAVQIGNAITEKKVTDVVLQARDLGLFNAITDCGAGGLSSAVGEMGEKTGAKVELDKVPLKYAGLRYDEIWISEAQERMVLAVPQDKVQQVLDLAAGENVEAVVIGQFGVANADLILSYNGQRVGQISMDFLHRGIPKRSTKAVATITATAPVEQPTAGKVSLFQRLLDTLAHPNIASKHWIIRQYDHEVQGGSVIKPLLGPSQVGPSDAAVLRPKLDSQRGIVLSCGMMPHMADPYHMAIASIDEAVRNAVAVGADLDRLAVLDNFCWPSVDDEKTMGTLARACQACYDAAKAYRIPFISGKDSLHNQFTNQETGQVIRIPNTLLISAMGVIADVRKCLTMDLKRSGSLLLLIEAADIASLDCLANTHRAMARLLAGGAALSCHDISDGGIAVSAAEMAIASGLGLRCTDSGSVASLFCESPGRYLVEVANNAQAQLFQEQLLPTAKVRTIGQVIDKPQVEILAGGETAKWDIEQLTKAWRGTLDW